MISKQIAISLFTLLPTAWLCAQDPATPPQTGSVAPKTQQPESKKDRGSNETDAIFATWLLTANNNGIALARLAQQKAQSADVKQFAQKLIDDHGQLTLKLQPFVGSSTATDRSTGDDDRGAGNERGATKGTERGLDQRDAAKSPRTSDLGTTPKSTATAAFDHTALVRDLGKKCLESETKMLNEKSGADFDRCYMGMQVAAHVMAADTMEVFGTYASDRLRPTLEAGRKTVAAHLEHAKTLCKQCENMGKQGEKIGSQGSR